jgi:predicted RNA binding protein YcfA (HicA-like mRNA interferase family)
LKAYSGKELIKLLEEYGWKTVRVDGSHHILIKQGREETISVPVHSSRSLKIGIIKSILRTAGIKL